MGLAEVIAYILNSSHWNHVQISWHLGQKSFRSWRTKKNSTVQNPVSMVCTFGAGAVECRLHTPGPGGGRPRRYSSLADSSLSYQQGTTPRTVRSSDLRWICVPDIRRIYVPDIVAVYVPNLKLDNLRNSGGIEKINSFIAEFRTTEFRCILKDNLAW